MPAFRFQRFSVIQDNAGMRVCTDASLFGAMAPVSAGDRVLDIGTGTGLLALMAAQLGAGHVTGVELTAEAYQEAVVNFRHSPWHDRLTAVHQDIRDFAENAARHYELIISNPPFFERHSKAAGRLKTIARHTDQLPFSALIEIADHCLSETGLFYALLPMHAVPGFINEASRYRLCLIYRSDIRAYAHLAAKVSALTFARWPMPPLQRQITVYRDARLYADASTHYLSAFLLRFSNTAVSSIKAPSCNHSKSSPADVENKNL
jgi:tRNA1Val (adenine37-N6)-methyltransferase